MGSGCVSSSCVSSSCVSSSSASSRSLRPRYLSAVRVAAALGVSGLLAACSSTAPVTTSSSYPANATVYSSPPPSARHAAAESGCAGWVSQAECRRVHAEGERLMRATCPANDASCARIEIVRARRINARTTELTIRDRQTGKQTKKRVSLETSAAAAQ